MKKRFAKVIFVIAGIAALFWFLIRVIPKPSRAAYPCQRAAFPLASSFVLWLLGTFGSFKLFKYGQEILNRHKLVRGIVIILSGGILFFASVFVFPGPSGFAGPLKSINDRFHDPFQSKIASRKSAEVVLVKDRSAKLVDSLPATVAARQSSHADVYEITYEEVESMIREVVSEAGGLADIISDGDTVILKPNMVADRGSDPFNGVTTNPWVIEITAKMVRELNPGGRIILMEATAGESGSMIMENLGYYDLKYIDEWIAIEEESGGWGEYDSPKLVAVEPPDSLSLYADELKPNKTRALYFNKIYFEADVVISLPTLKNHNSAGVTGAVKNVAMGTAPANIYGDEERTGAYANLRQKGLDHGHVEIHKWLHDFYAAKPIDFCIVDGLQGIQYGPIGGGELQSAQKNMRLILAGRDPVAVDAIMSLSMLHDPQKVNYLVYLHNHNFGIVDPSLISLKGISIPEVRQDFLMGDNGDIISKFSKTTAWDYEAICKFRKDEFLLSVTNPDKDLARLTIFIDDQFIGKYVLGGFEEVVIPTSGIVLSEGNIEVLFEDRYLNAIRKTYQASIPAYFSLQIASTNGTVEQSPLSSSYEVGSTVSLTAVPDEGFEFASWSGDLSGTENPLLLTMDSSMNITANFALVQGLSQDKGLESIVLFPNPSSGEFFLSVKDGGVSKYHVYNMKGVQIQSGNFESDTRIDIKGRGSYIIHIETEKEKFVQKLIVQ